MKWEHVAKSHFFLIETKVGDPMFWKDYINKQTNKPELRIRAMKCVTGTMQILPKSSCDRVS